MKVIYYYPGRLSRPSKAPRTFTGTHEGRVLTVVLFPAPTLNELTEEEIAFLKGSVAFKALCNSKVIVPGETPVSKAGEEEEKTSRKKKP